MREPMEFDNAMTNYEDVMDMKAEKLRGLSRRCPACLLGWADCRCDRFCSECRCLTNHDTLRHWEAEDEQRASQET